MRHVAACTRMQPRRHHCCRSIKPTLVRLWSPTSRGDGPGARRETTEAITLLARMLLLVAPASIPTWGRDAQS